MISKITPEQFKQVFMERMSIYACAGIDALYDLAMMDVSFNSMQNQVKLIAAKSLVELATKREENLGDGVVLDSLMTSMNDAYHKHSTRIREVRKEVTTVVVEQEPKLVSP